MRKMEKKYNIENLKPIKKGDLSEEELKKRQKNGGKKSAEVRREKRDLKERLEIAHKFFTKKAKEQAKKKGDLELEELLEEIGLLEYTLLQQATSKNSSPDVVLKAIAQINDRIEGKAIQMQINQNENTTEYVFVTEKDQKQVDKNLKSLINYSKKD